MGTAADWVPTVAVLDVVHLTHSHDTVLSALQWAAGSAISPLECGLS